MTLSKPSRRLVAGVAALLLLACQSLVVVRAGTFGAPQSGTGAALESCHAAGQGPGGTENDVRQAGCSSQYTSSSPASINVPAAIDLPAITVHFEWSAVIAGVVPLAESQLAFIEPPPLSILYCCLRN